MKTITLNKEEYVAKSDVDNMMKTGKVKPTKMQIVILQRGWVVIGRFSQKGVNCHLTDASVVRYFGTTKGLGEIAFNGPTDKTKLDACPDVHFHELTVVARMDVDESKWLVN